jgi:two-component system response regulator VanR
LTSILKSAKVVVVDDNHTTIELIKSVLAPTIFNVLGVDSSTDGLKAASKFNPDVIIIDSLSPKKNLLEICKDIRSRSNIPILVLSAVNKPGMLEQTLNAGADEYLIKPVPANILVAHLKTLARRFQEEKKARFRFIGNVSN